jgi:DNA modification methylase
MTGRYKVIHGDCRAVVPTLPAFDFIFADPPFNIGHPYTGYDDNKSCKDYADFTISWVERCWAKCRGIMCLHGPDDLAQMYLIWEAFAQAKRVAWVNWHYRFGVCHRHNWIDARCHCLIYAKDPHNYTWNPDAVLVPSDRVAYADKRVTQTANGGMRLPGTVWGVPSDGPYWGRVQGNSGERRPAHPNQLPEVYLERLIKAYTNPGDRVLDPFGGSGTTATVAVALGRDCITIDISEHNVASIRERIAAGPVRIT